MTAEQEPVEVENEPVEDDGADRAEFDAMFGKKPKFADKDADDDAEVEEREPAEERRAPAKKTTSKPKPRAGDEEADEDEPARDADESEAEEEAEDEDSASDDEESDEEDSDAGPSEYERARRLLKLKQKLSDDDLHGISKRAVIRMAQSWRDAQREEATWKQRAEAKAEGGEPEKARTDVREPNGPALKGLRDAMPKLTAAFDKDGAEAIASYLEEALGSLVDGFGKRVESVEKSTSDVKGEAFRGFMRAKLQRKHPEWSDALDDDRTWGAVVNEAKRLAEDDEGVGEFDSLDAVLVAAAERKLAGRSKKAQSFRKQTSGAPKAPVARKTAPREKSEDELEREAFNASRIGDPKERKRRLDKLNRDPFG